MTPEAITAYIHLTDGRVRAALTGEAAPNINLILRTGGRLNFAFVDGDGDIVELEAGTTGKLVIKSESGADEAPLFRDATIEDNGESDEDIRYFFKGLIDSDDLRTALNGLRSASFVAQVIWEQPSDDEPSASLPFDLTITQNYHRDDDAAPIITADTEFVLNDDESAAEMFVNGVSKGFVHLHTTAP